MEIEPEEPIQIEMLDQEQEELSRTINIFKFQHKCSAFLRVTIGIIIMFNVVQNIQGWDLISDERLKLWAIVLYAVQGLNLPLSTHIFLKVNCSNFVCYNRVTKASNLVLLCIGVNVMSLRYKSYHDEAKLKEETKNILYNILLMAAFSIGPSVLDFLVYFELFIQMTFDCICLCVPCRKIKQRKQQYHLENWIGKRKRAFDPEKHKVAECSICLGDFVKASSPKEEMVVI